MTPAPAKPAKLPPGPKGRPLVGNLLDYSRDPLEFLTRCAREYGGVVRLNFPGPPAYLLSNPEHIEQVLVGNNRNFIKDRVTRGELSILGDGLLTSDGDFWRRQRRLAQPAFHRERIENYAGTMVAYTERMLEGWRDGEQKDIHRDMMRLTLEIVAKTLVDTDIAGEAEDVGDALGAVMAHFSDQGSGVFLRMLPDSVPTPSNLRYRRAQRRLEEFIYGIIDERRRSGRDTGDLLSMLLHARDEDGGRMSDEQLRDEVMTVIMAGHETTAIALSWTWRLLALHPEVEKKLHSELDERLGDAPTVDDLPHLPYSSAVLKESLRLYPPAWAIGREAVEDCEIGGYHVPAKTQLFISQYVVHHDPRFFDNPDVFDPNRWTDGLEKRLPKYAYFPFGGGPRLCIGQSFARMEAALLLATIARKFRVRLSAGERATPQPSITLRPKNGIRVALEDRQPSR
ncbi:MAG: cytochrome P450 [Rubrobacteraceae bacterium]